jgi:glutamate carboxypeptidase
MANWGEEQGGQVRILRQAVVGDFVQMTWNAEQPSKPLLILCHLDTVHELGSVEKRPTHIEEETLFGVGAYDMKAGITIVQTVIEALRSQHLLTRPIELLLTSDEEIGSPYSRRVIEQLAQGAELALVMEFCNYQEELVTARKGVGIFQVTALGRESHSGSAPEKGINAVVELSRQINSILALADPSQGTLVNPTVIRGGTRHNVIPGECDLVVNVRVSYHEEARRIQQALEALTDQPTAGGAELILTGEFMRPPMERDAVMQQTLATLKQIMGVQLGEEGRGGGSDGCFPSSLGIPTLDGLGASGEGAHAANEQVYLPSMVHRAALLAAIIQGWPQTPR